MIFKVHKKDFKESVVAFAVYADPSKPSLGCSHVPAIIFWMFSKLILVQFCSVSLFRNEEKKNDLAKIKSNVLEHFSEKPKLTP